MLDGGLSSKVAAVNRRILVGAGALVVGLVVAGCSSGSATPSTNPTTSRPTTTSQPTTTAPPATTAPTATPATAAAATTSATCPTVAQVNAALGVSLTTHIQNPSPGGGVICIYNGAGAVNAEVAIFAHQSASVFAGQVAHAPGAPAMPALTGVGDGAFGQDVAGRAIVNAYSNGSRTLVAAQAAGPLPPVEAFARVALADN
jgi:hypothetical protein